MVNEWQVRIGNKYLELDEQFSPVFDYQSYDIESDSVVGENAILNEIPYSAVNSDALGRPEDINSADWFDLTLNQEIFIYKNGNIHKTGYVSVVSAIWRQDYSKGYKVEFVSGNKLWAEQIKDKELRNLTTFEYLDHIYNWTSIVFKNDNNTLPIVYPMIMYGKKVYNMSVEKGSGSTVIVRNTLHPFKTGQPVWQQGCNSLKYYNGTKQISVYDADDYMPINMVWSGGTIAWTTDVWRGNDAGSVVDGLWWDSDFYPAFKIADVFRAIFNEIGYVISSAFFDSKFGEMLIMPFCNERMCHRLGYTQMSFPSTVSSPVGKPYFYVGFCPDSTASGIMMDDYTENVKLKKAVNTGLPIDVGYTGGVITAGTMDGYYFKKGNNIKATLSITGIDNSALGRIVSIISHIVVYDISDTGVYSVREDRIYQTDYPVHSLNATLTHERIDWDVECGDNTFVSFYAFGLRAGSLATGLAWQTAVFKIETEDENGFEVSCGEHYDVTWQLPKIKQLDYVKAVSKLLNLQYHADENLKTIYIEPFDQFYRSKTDVNNKTLTPYLDLSQDVEIMNTEKKKSIKYKYQDSDDYCVATYAKRITDPISWYSPDVHKMTDSDFVAETDIQATMTKRFRMRKWYEAVITSGEQSGITANELDDGFKIPWYLSSNTQDSDTITEVNTNIGLRVLLFAGKTDLNGRYHSDPADPLVGTESEYDEGIWYIDQSISDIFHIDDVKILRYWWKSVFYDNADVTVYQNGLTTNLGSINLAYNSYDADLGLKDKYFSMRHAILTEGRFLTGSMFLPEGFIDGLDYRDIFWLEIEGENIPFINPKITGYKDELTSCEVTLTKYPDFRPPTAKANLPSLYYDI